MLNTFFLTDNSFLLFPRIAVTRTWSTTLFTQMALSSLFTYSLLKEMEQKHITKHTSNYWCSLLFLGKWQVSLFICRLETFDQSELSHDLNYAQISPNLYTIKQLLNLMAFFVLPTPWSLVGLLKLIYIMFLIARLSHTLFSKSDFPKTRSNHFLHYLRYFIVFLPWITAF